MPGRTLVPLRFELGCRARCMGRFLDARFVGRLAVIPMIWTFPRTANRIQKAAPPIRGRAGLVIRRAAFEPTERCAHEPTSREVRDVESADIRRGGVNIGGLNRTGFRGDPADRVQAAAVAARR